jgi:hypothetical protein
METSLLWEVSFYLICLVLLGCNIASVGICKIGLYDTRKGYKRFCKKIGYLV